MAVLPPRLLFKPWDIQMTDFPRVTPGTAIGYITTDMPSVYNIASARSLPLNPESLCESAMHQLIM